MVHVHRRVAPLRPSGPPTLRLVGCWSTSVGVGYCPGVRAFHVTSSRNRESIGLVGLDWERMAASPGIAGSLVPEVAGVFLCQDQFEVAWFVRMNNTGGPVEVWSVQGVDYQSLIDNGSGYHYVSNPIPPDRLTLIHRDLKKIWAAPSQ